MYPTPSARRFRRKCTCPMAWRSGFRSLLGRASSSMVLSSTRARSYARRSSSKTVPCLHTRTRRGVSLQLRRGATRTACGGASFLEAKWCFRVVGRVLQVTAREDHSGVELLHYRTVCLPSRGPTECADHWYHIADIVVDFKECNFPHDKKNHDEPKEYPFTILHRPLNWLERTGQALASGNAPRRGLSAIADELCAFLRLQVTGENPF